MNISRRRVVYGIIGFTLGSIAAVVLWQSVHSQASEPPLVKADAEQLAATIVVPCIGQPLDQGKNVVWCSTFQLVWNEACRYAGGNIHLDNEPPAVATLNRKEADLADLDAGSCVLASGLVQDNVVQKIREELQRKFHDTASPDLLNELEPSLPSDGWLAYAYLFRKLTFEHPFQRLSEPLIFGDKPVMAFGMKRDAPPKQKMAVENQILVWDYKTKDDFIVELMPEDKSERILLAKITPCATLEKTIDTARARAADDGKTRYGMMFGSNDTLIVPVLNFDLRREYRELKGKKIITSGPLQDSPVIAALQTIRFRLDERGVLLKSAAAMAAKCAASKDDPRSYVFDAPFLILLERRSATQPYLAVWVDNPELLAKAATKNN